MYALTRRTPCGLVMVTVTGVLSPMAFTAGFTPTPGWSDITRQHDDREDYQRGC